ncbi:MAG TPA: ion channel [Microlunatus sp.]
MSDEARRLRWERAASWPLTAAALLFLTVYSWPVLNPDLAPSWQRVCRITTVIVWVIFAIDYVARFVLAGDRRTFVKRHLLDLAVVVLPMLRPLRLLRLLTLFNILGRNTGRSFRGRVAMFVVAATSLILFVSSVAVLNAERGRDGANIDSFGDALWWSLTTVTTVGYGDRYPITLTGRCVAAGLMLAGIALLGVVTASLASWFLDRVTATEEAEAATTEKMVAALTSQVAELTDQVSQMRRDLARQQVER